MPVSDYTGAYANHLENTSEIDQDQYPLPQYDQRFRLSSTCITQKPTVHDNPEMSLFFLLLVQSVTSAFRDVEM